MLRRTLLRRYVRPAKSRQSFRQWFRDNVSGVDVFDPMKTKSVFFASFFLAQMGLAFMYFIVFPQQHESKFESEKAMNKLHDDFASRMEDKKRPPWPVLHQRVTEMREGKRPLDELQKFWDETKYYYEGDWLIPMELAQILKYSTGRYLGQFVRDPEELRKELIRQLENVKYGRVMTIDTITRDVQEIINVALSELNNSDFTDLDKIPLVPTHTK